VESWSREAAGPRKIHAARAVYTHGRQHASILKVDTRVFVDAGTVIGWAWIVFLLYWLAAAFRLNQMKRLEPAHERMLRFIVMVIAFLLLFKSRPEFGPLNERFIPDISWISAVGAALVCFGIAFAIWARYHIGRYWSSTVSLRADHQLIRTGPYSWIRHPIYTGILLALAGTALAVGRYRAVLGLAIMFAGFVWKAKREEDLLSTEFGPAFQEHKRLTGFFLPRIS
jgi:protein-S-isoprenylcysteine O-methyltransferase Ste14